MNESKRFASAVFGIALFVACLVGGALLVVGWGMKHFGLRDHRGVQPALSGQEDRNFDRGLVFRAHWREKQQELESYGWVDRKSEIARVPIEVAMKIYLEQKQVPEPAHQEATQ